MKAINPYLNFTGNTEEVFDFYKSVFGGTFTTLQRFGDNGQSENLSEEDRNKIMHVSLKTESGMVLMASDAIGFHKDMISEGTNISLSIDAASKEEADRLFNGLADGGITTMPIADTFWGAYFGMLTDKFGIQWMVNYDK